MKPKTILRSYLGGRGGQGNSGQRADPKRHRVLTQYALKDIHGRVRPDAMRTPISRVLCATVNASSPKIPSRASRLAIAPSDATTVTIFRMRIQLPVDDALIT